jgi:hypothetical protein
MEPSPLTADALLAKYQPLVGVRLNIAVDADGSVAKESGSSDDVSNSLDRRLLAHLRSMSDVIVTSGATARAENLKSSQHAPIVVLSPSGSTDGLQNLLEGKWPLTIVLQPAAYDRTQEWLSHVGAVANVMSLAELSPEAVLRHLRARGYERILLEFGPKLSSLWSSSGVIDEVCLSTTGLSRAQSRDEARRVLPAFIDSSFAQIAADVYVSEVETRFRRLRRN